LWSAPGLEARHKGTGRTLIGRTGGSHPLVKGSTSSPSSNSPNTVR